MRERVGQLDGEMAIHSSSSGTVVDVALPFREDSHDPYLTDIDPSSKSSWC
jgi:signal transduction histidine kinase